MSAHDRRLTPLEPEEFGEDARRLLGGTRDRVAALEGRPAEPQTRPLNILRTLAHHPRLLEPFLAFATALAGGVLPRRSSELLALRAANEGARLRGTGLRDKERVRELFVRLAEARWSSVR